VIVEDQSEVVAFLSRADSYGAAGPVERLETHISLIFLVGDRAYKLKRAVRFPYLDFSTADRRRLFCEAEVRVNRRTAPDLYDGVRPIVRTPAGGLALGGDGPAVDWVVAMVRFDQDLLFDRLAVAGRLDRFAMEELADVIARFHDEAERRPDGGGRAQVERVIESNARSFADSGGVVADDAVAALTAASRRVLDGVGEILETRRRGGSVRHGHGDLHLRNIVLFRGRATLFDAIEFSTDLADIDILYDLAFLVMDLHHRDLTALASIVLNRYLDRTGDADGLAALPLFLSLRAAIRSHVDAAASASVSDPAEAAALRREAQLYLDEAMAYLAPPAPRLIAVGGLSGSGKSRLARALAPCVGGPPGARVVRTDMVRKRLAGVAPTTRLAPGGYSREMTERTYRAVFDECHRVLAAGRSAIADAVFLDPWERNGIERVAAALGVPFSGLWLEASPAVLMERVTRRKLNASDATPPVVRMQLAIDPGDVTWCRLDTDSDKDAVLAAARASLGL
jgi:hypothetical protein